MSWSGQAFGWAAGTFLGQRDDNPFGTGPTSLQVLSWASPQLSLKAGGGGAQQQQRGKGVTAVVVGIRMQPPPIAFHCCHPFWPHHSSAPPQTPRVCQRRRDRKQCWGQEGRGACIFLAPIACPISSLHLCRCSPQLPLSSVLLFPFPSPARPAQLRCHLDFTLTRLLGGCPPTSAESSFVLHGIILGGGDKDLLIPMEIEPCSSHTSTNSILHCVNRPANPVLFFLLEKSQQRGTRSRGKGGGHEGGICSLLPPLSLISAINGHAWCSTGTFLYLKPGAEGGEKEKSEENAQLLRNTWGREQWTWD